MVVHQFPEVVIFLPNNNSSITQVLYGEQEVKSKISSSTTTTTTDMTTTTKTKTILQYMVKDTIIDAIPVNVGINDNPLDEAKTYKIMLKFTDDLSPKSILF